MRRAPEARLPGILASLHARGISMAIGSSGRRAQIESNLSVSGFMSYFSAIASGDEVLHGKPAPDIFLLAAKDWASLRRIATSSRTVRMASVRRTQPA